ncbi:hypothetical protein Pint_29688 [Pistacia integerrima]|uniref:Uncharacterized protein n=1 Tax=Pistacia integerrima TaxID=434235 RepID=A0ACC0X1L7_9ROSI|nr:hypothetical protein Pint_29688 [Pistacia integerrima]
MTQLSEPKYFPSEAESTSNSSSCSPPSPSSSGFSSQSHQTFPSHLSTHSEPATKAASMIKFDSSSSSSSQSQSPSQPPSSSADVSAESEELGEIVELPNIEGSGFEVISIDLFDGWVYPPEEFSGEFSEQIFGAESLIPSNFEACSSVWD